MDKAYQEVLDKVEKKPLMFKMPEVVNFIEPEFDKDYIFELVYDTYPEISYDDYKGTEVVKDEIDIEDSEIDKELNIQLKELATVVEKTGKIVKGDIVYVNYFVKDGKEEIYRNENEYIDTGANFDSYKIGENLFGMKKGDNKVFDKKFGDDDIDSLKGKTLSFDVTINEVKEEKIPELTEDICKEIDPECTTKEQLREKIRNKMAKYGDDFIKAKIVNSIVDKVANSFKGNIPESMIETQLKMSLDNFKNKFKGNKQKIKEQLEKEGMTEENFNEKMRDKTVEVIKKALIQNDIAKKEKIEVSKDEILEHLKQYSQYYRTDANMLYEYFEKNGQLTQFIEDIEQRKVGDKIFEGLKIKKGKKIKLSDLTKKESADV